ncbi:MAG: hypothetical protein NDI70_00865 [Pseudomonas sagittaria]|nr:hypothetical protein [Pseudomonas sagittaria]
MSRNQWLDLLPTTGGIAAMTPEQRERMASAADYQARTLAWGVSAIGSLVAGAALNEEAGIDAGKLADLGWLLQSMGELGAVLIDTHEGARLRTGNGGAQ